MLFNVCVVLQSVLELCGSQRRELLYRTPAAALPAGRQGSGHAPHIKLPLERLDALLTGHVQCVVCAPDITLRQSHAPRHASSAVHICPHLCHLLRPLLCYFWLLHDLHTVYIKPAISWVTYGGCSRRLECPSCTRSRDCQHSQCGLGGYITRSGCGAYEVCLLGLRCAWAHKTARLPHVQLTLS
jgi:hypothetical protein